MERLNQLVEWLVAAPAAAAKWFIDLSTVRWSRRAKLVVTGAVLMNAFVGLAANWWVKTGGILEDPITDEHNPLVVENRRASAPFWGTDTVVFWLDRQGLTDEDAIAVYRDMHWQLYEKLPWAQEGLLSPHFDAIPSGGRRWTSDQHVHGRGADTDGGANEPSERGHRARARQPRPKPLGHHDHPATRLQPVRPLLGVDGDRGGTVMMPQR